jgi:hypothetical protein
MKTTIKFLAALLIIINFTSCDDLTEVKFDTTVTENIDVSITKEKSSEAILFDEEVVIDLKDGSGEIQDYLQYIKEINVKELQYEFINNSADAMITADLYVDGVKYLSIDNMSLNELVQNATPYLIEAMADLEAIATTLESNKNMTIRYTGEITTEEDVDFSIKVVSKLGITADPI